MSRLLLTGLAAAGWAALAAIAGPAQVNLATLRLDAQMAQWSAAAPPSADEIARLLDEVQALLVTAPANADLLSAAAYLELRTADLAHDPASVRQALRQALAYAHATRVARPMSVQDQNREVLATVRLALAQRTPP